MNDLAEFLELVHTATTRWRSVVATGDYTIDLGAVRAGAEKIFGSQMNFPLPPGITAMPTGIERRPFLLSARRREFVRVEQTGEDRTIAILRPDGTATRDSSGEWSFEAAVDHFRIPQGRMPIRLGGPVGGPQSFGMVTMLDPPVCSGRVDSSPRKQSRSTGDRRSNRAGARGHRCSLAPGSTMFIWPRRESSLPSIVKPEFCFSSATRRSHPVGVTDTPDRRDRRSHR